LAADRYKRRHHLGRKKVTIVGREITAYTIPSEVPTTTEASTDLHLSPHPVQVTAGIFGCIVLGTVIRRIGYTNKETNRT